MSFENNNEDDFVVNAETGSGFEPAPTGNHIAVCNSVIVLGTVDQTYNGHVKRKPTVKIGFELSNTKRVLEDGTEIPFVVYRDYTFKMFPGKGLQKMLEDWRGGERFTKEEAKNFNIMSIVGAGCMVNVTHSTSEKTGNKYANVSGVANIPEGIDAPAPKLPLVRFAWLEPLKEKFMAKTFNELPEWIQNIIKSSDQYLEIQGALPKSETTAPTNTAPAATTGVKKRPF